MRQTAPIVRVPELGALLMTTRDDIFSCEKNTAVFSSWQPDGLMTKLMGTNMMRRDGAEHQHQRKQMFPAVSPPTVRDYWRSKFASYAVQLLDDLEAGMTVDLISEYAMPLSANALRELTGLLCLTPREMDEVSQAMIDGCANYAGDPGIETRCHSATARIDQSIDDMLAKPDGNPSSDILNVLVRAGQQLEHIRANLKLVISGGQNEPRDAIAGCIWALLTHPEQGALVATGDASWAQVFDEYVRWISPIGMSPRRINSDYDWQGITLRENERLFLMFNSANRDEGAFDHPEQFDIQRTTAKAVAFGAGPHFCAGAAVSRTLIADVALPMFFERFPNTRVAGEVPFGGWAFRGPLAMPVTLA